jgi:uncharacterized membrane-anchored protein
VRRLIVGAAGLIILAVANVGIYQKEQLVTSGRSVLLELAPVDPRSLMQGDYMALRFAIENEAFRGVPRETLTDGRLVLALDDRGVGRFVRFDDGVAVGSQEVLMRYRVRGGSPKFGTNAYFFQEGSADLYADAKFGEFRVSPSGDAILTTMRGPKLEVLGPPR